MLKGYEFKDNEEPNWVTGCHTARMVVHGVIHLVLFCLKIELPRSARKGGIYNMWLKDIANIPCSFFFSPKITSEASAKLRWNGVWDGAVTVH